MIGKLREYLNAHKFTALNYTIELLKVVSLKI
jgi:hypothetical protein